MAAYDQANVYVVNSIFESNKAALGAIFSAQYHANVYATDTVFKKNIGTINHYPSFY